MATDRQVTVQATGGHEWRTLADVDSATIAELRRKVCAVEAERDVYRRALRTYANRHNWARNPASEADTCDVFLLTCDGYTPAEDALAQFKEVVL